MGVERSIKVLPAAKAVFLAYLLSVLFLFPYGFEVIAGSALRIPDLLAIATIGVAGIAIISTREFRLYPLAIAPLAIFVVLELTFPVLGGVLYGGISDILSAARMAFLWLPVLLILGLYSPRELRGTEHVADRLFQFGLVANGMLVTIHMLVIAGMLPNTVLPAVHLEPFAIDGFFQAAETTRPPGWFRNVTELSVFAIIALCFYLGRLHYQKRRSDLAFASLAVAIIFVSTARVAVIAVALLLGIWLLLQPREQMMAYAAAIGSVIVVTVISVLAIRPETFDRLTRLSGGISSDESFAQRFTEYWPRALEATDVYPLGTFVNPVEIVGIIDSGFLTYWAQGTVFFATALVLLFSGSVWVAWRSYNQGNWAALALILLVAYLVPAMVFSNPMRRPVTIFGLVYFLHLSVVLGGSVSSKRVSW